MCIRDRGKRILLAEDQELNREIIATLLARNGCYVEAVENGKQAFEKFVLQGAGSVSYTHLMKTIPQRQVFSSPFIVTFVRMAIEVPLSNQKPIKRARGSGGWPKE